MEINKLIHEAHQNATDKGFYGEDGKEERNLGEVIALMHSELSEVLEEARVGHDATKVYYECKGEILYACWHRSRFAGKTFCGNSADCKFKKPCGIPSEFADLCIRVFDTCGQYGIDLEKAIKEKMDFNKTRPHKHGKKF